MNFINLLKKLFLKSQFYVSFCAVLLGVFILQEQDSYYFPLVLVLFLTFWNGYFFTVFHKKKDAIIWNLVGFVIIIFLIFKFLNLEFFFKWLVILVLGTFYNSDIFNINIREFWLVKTFYVGFVWAMSLVWLPLNNGNFISHIDSINMLFFIKLSLRDLMENFNIFPSDFIRCFINTSLRDLVENFNIFSSDFIRCFINSSLRDFPVYSFLIIFLFISAITFPYEIRDMKRDPFPTLPKAIGIRNTKILSILFLVSSGVLSLLFLERKFAISFTVTVFISIILVIFSDKKRSDLYYSFFLESLSALPVLIYFILNLLKI